jgi:hypothetical protein
MQHREEPQVSTGDTITIGDKAAFPAKVSAIRDATAQLRTAAAALSQIADTAAKESASFTRDGAPAPVYTPLLEELRAWLNAISPAAKAVCDSAENAAATAEAKFTAITTTDSAAAAAVAST